MDITPDVSRERAVSHVLLEVLSLKASTVELGTRRHRQVPMTGGWCSDRRTVARKLVALSLDRLKAIASRRKSGSSCSSSLLYRAYVLVLMPSQSSTASERLLAIGIRAFIGAISGMGTTMTSQRTAVTKSLLVLMR